MLKAYIDDSHMRQPPFYVLGGWVAPVKAWVAFSDAWRDVLRMSPRIEYFKYDEAMGLSGQFLGISAAARDEKLRLLVNVIEEHGLVGVASAIPHSIFYPMFGTYPHKWVRNPYYISFYGIAARVVAFVSANGTKEKVEFIFDFQPGSDQMREAQEGWASFREMAPPEMLDCVQVHPPSFLDDKDVVALQAADLHAGWTRETLMLLDQGKTAQPPWHPCGKKITSTSVSWSLENLSTIFRSMFGFGPLMISYTFDYGIPAKWPSFAQFWQLPSQISHRPRQPHEGK
jgi:hypothetical protein